VIILLDYTDNDRGGWCSASPLPGGGFRVELGLCVRTKRGRKESRRNAEEESIQFKFDNNFSITK